jgi:hypothetical protein
MQQFRSTGFRATSDLGVHGPRLVLENVHIARTKTLGDAVSERGAGAPRWLSSTTASTARIGERLLVEGSGEGYGAIIINRICSGFPP